MHSMFFSFLRLIAALGTTVIAGNSATRLFRLFEHSDESHLIIIFFSISVIFALSCIIFYLSRGLPLPNFVIAIFFGMAARPLLEPVIEAHAVLGALVGFGATLILFGGGLETPFTSFKRLLPYILSLSFLGLILTAILTAFTVESVGRWMGGSTTIATAILLGAILASTDPAAIIPVLKRLRFKRSSIKDIIVSESAVTDVTGTLLTVSFIGKLIAVGLGSSVIGGFAALINPVTGILLLKQIVLGIVFGILGYSLLALLTKFKEGHEREYEADSAFFLFIPIMIFSFALAFGGSGYLAAFIAGLLFKITEQLHETERFFNHIIDGFFKPTIFLLLGALVDIDALAQYAGIGLLVSCLFMFVIRPLAVFASIGFTLKWGRDRFSWRDLLFISCVRETGAIPAVLLVTIASMNLHDLDGLLPIGMWVIMITLIVEPPLTPWLAKKLKVADVIPETTVCASLGNKPFVVLGTRGESYKSRLLEVSRWAHDRGIKRVDVQLCLEYKYQPDLEQRMREDAEAQFIKTNELLAAEGSSSIAFTFHSSTGLLQETIDFLATHNEKLVAIFVGRKMLDYRITDIKKLSVPLYFME